MPTVIVAVGALLQATPTAPSLDLYPEVDPLVDAGVFVTASGSGPHGAAAGTTCLCRRTGVAYLRTDVVTGTSAPSSETITFGGDYNSASGLARATRAVPALSSQVQRPARKYWGTRISVPRGVKRTCDWSYGGSAANRQIAVDGTPLGVLRVAIAWTSARGSHTWTGLFELAQDGLDAYVMFADTAGPAPALMQVAAAAAAGAAVFNPASMPFAVTTTLTYYPLGKLGSFSQNTVASGNNVDWWEDVPCVRQTLLTLNEVLALVSTAAAAADDPSMAMVRTQQASAVSGNGVAVLTAGPPVGNPSTGGSASAGATSTSSAASAASSSD